MRTGETIFGKNTVFDLLEDIKPRDSKGNLLAIFGKLDLENKNAWEIFHSDTSRPFPKPDAGRIAVKVMNHLGNEVIKISEV